MNKIAVLDKQIKQDIRAILDYLWHDEEKHYSECKYPKDHIFCVIKRLTKAIKHEPRF